MDESGDTGFKSGSSRYFVITLLITEEPDAIRAAVASARTACRYPKDAEFKFYKAPHRTRVAFLTTLATERFSIRALVIDKTMMTRPQMRRRETFYGHLTHLVLIHDEGMIQGAHLILDESFQSKHAKQSFTSYLRKALNSDPLAPKLAKVTYPKSHSDDGVQAVDMISGAIFHAFARDDDQYFGLISKRVAECWVWKPEEES